MQTNSTSSLGKVIASDKGITFPVVLLNGICLLVIVIACGILCAMVPEPEALVVIGIFGALGAFLMVSNIFGSGSTKITVHENGVVGVGTSKMAFQLGTTLFDLRNFDLTYDKVSSVEVNRGMYSGSISICVSGTEYLVFGGKAAEIQRIIVEQQRKDVRAT